VQLPAAHRSLAARVIDQAVREILGGGELGLRDAVARDVDRQRRFAEPRRRGRGLRAVEQRARQQVLGGVLRRNQQSLVGPLAEQVLGQLSADVMFLSCTGVRGGRVLDNMAVEAPIKHALIAASHRIVLLASELKFPGSGALRLCSLDEVDVLITTPGTPEEEIAQRRENGRKVIVA